jgi:cyclophilin family peptidyl-prolyl cis-trans isomerase
MRVLAVLLVLVLALAGCGGGSTHKGAVKCASVAQSPVGGRAERAPSGMLDVKKTYEVVMKTNCGTFTIRIDPGQSPHAAASFVALVRAGYYDRTIFNRIVPDVLVQGGDPTATGTGGPGYTTVDTPPASMTYEHGVVAMAKTKAQPAGTAGGQFVIVTAETTQLVERYAIIGKVVKGLDVVDMIGTLGGGSDLPSQVQHVSDAPTRIVEIEAATVVIS